MIDLAIEIAAKAHRNQVRKGADIPYIAHPYSVGMMLLKEGCEDDVVIAGILHDTVEDTDLTFDDIKEVFGEHVADLVKGCSEHDKSLPWEERKTHTLNDLKTAPLDVRIITVADKLHNIRSTIQACEELGEAAWDRFTRGREKQTWYYKGLVEVLCHREDNPSDMALFKEFEREVYRIFKK